MLRISTWLLKGKNKIVHRRANKCLYHLYINIKQHKSSAEPNWLSTPYRNYSGLLSSPECSDVSYEYSVMDCCLSRSLWMILPFCFDVLGWMGFHFCRTTVISMVSPPHSSPSSLSSDWWQHHWGENPAVNYRKLQEPQENKIKIPTNKQTSFSNWVNVTPGSLTLASKDCLQSLPWYAHVDIWRSLDVFFFLFIFSFFLMVCKSI